MNLLKADDYLSNNPRFLIHSSSFTDHPASGDFVFRPSPTPCWPSSYSTNSTGTPAFSQAALNIRLFSIGTALSCTVWNRNVGGVFAVTCFSLE